MPDGVLGRELELHAARALVTTCEAGPSALLIEGEAGIGKTAIWQVGVDEARRRSLHVLTAAPTRSESHLAFAALADLLEPVVDPLLPTLAEPQRHALAVALLRVDSGPHHLDQRAVSAAVLSVLRSLAGTHPVLVAIDDLQWLDRPTANVLTFALRRLAGSPTRVLGCVRIGEVGILPLDLDAAMPERPPDRIRLGPLSVAVLHQMIKARLGRSLSRRTLLNIERAAGGNPFFALEVARALPDDAPSSAPILTFPDNLRHLVERRVGTLPRSTQLALLGAASLHAPTVELVRQATNASEPSVRRAIESAVSAGIMEETRGHLRFSHPLYAAVVYSTASAAERRRIHRRLALVVDEVEEQARHIALGADRPDAERAAIVDLAAEHARGRGAPETASELAEYARHLTPPHEHTAMHRRSIQAAEYRLHAGDLRNARLLLEDVLRVTPAGRLRGDALRLLGEVRYHENSFPEAVRLLQAALEHVQGAPNVSAEIELHLTFATVSGADFVGIEAHARRALTYAEECGEPALIAEALAVVSMADFLRGRGLDRVRIQRALDLEDVHRQVAVEIRPSLIAGCLALYVGELDRSLEFFGRLREQFLDGGEEIDLAYVAAQMAWAECLKGRLARAAAYAEESVEVAERIGSDAAHCMGLAFAALSAAYAGHAAPAEERAAQVVALSEQTGYGVAVLWSQWALAVLALSQGRMQAAVAAVRPFLAMVEHEGIEEPIRAPYLADAIEALIALEELDRADRLITKLEEAGRRLERQWVIAAAARCRALFFAATGDMDRALQCAEEAVELCEGIEHRLELARSLLVAGEIQRRRRRKRSAGELLRRSLDLFEEAGARLWADRARSSIARTGIERRAPDRLSSAEERVAELAASGLTNREVAAALFMSPKTVEANLAHAYRKLGIRSRAELGARMIREARVSVTE